MSLSKEVIYKELINLRRGESIFNPSQVQLLQVLVNGLFSNNDIAGEMGLSARTLRNRKDGIRLTMKNVGEEGTLKRAVAVAVLTDSVDTTRLPENPQEKLDNPEVEVLTLHFLGLSDRKIREKLNLTKQDLKSCDSRITAKFGKLTLYQIMAVAAKMAKRKLEENGSFAKSSS